MMNYKTDFNKILKNLRKEREITQRELSKETGISLSMITKYEQGINTPSIQNLRILSDFFKVPIRTFLVEEVEPLSHLKISKYETIDIDNYDFSSNDEKFKNISNGKEYIYHLLKFLECVGFEILIDERKNIFNIRSEDPKYPLNVFWSINMLQFQIQFLRSIVIDYSYQFFKEIDEHMAKKNLKE